LYLCHALKVRQLAFVEIYFLDKSLKGTKQMPSQAKPSQAKPSQAKPSQAKPSQAKPMDFIPADRFTDCMA
jgi:hypothetical protein